MVRLYTILVFNGISIFNLPQGDIIYIKIASQRKLSELISRVLEILLPYVVYKTPQMMMHKSHLATAV